MGPARQNEAVPKIRIGNASVYYYKLVQKSIVFLFCAESHFFKFEFKAKNATNCRSLCLKCILNKLRKAYKAFISISRKSLDHVPTHCATPLLYSIHTYLNLYAPPLFITHPCPFHPYPSHILNKLRNLFAMNFLRVFYDLMIKDPMIMISKSTMMTTMV